MNGYIHHFSNSDIVAFQEIDRESDVDQVVVVSDASQLKQLQEFTVIQVTFPFALFL